MYVYSFLTFSEFKLLKALDLITFNFNDNQKYWLARQPTWTIASNELLMRDFNQAPTCTYLRRSYADIDALVNISLT